MKIKIIKDWEDDLIQCPSQCYKNIEHDGKRYTIYLRWRWNDPWTASLVPCEDKKFDIHSDLKWINLKIDAFKEEELESLKQHVEEVVQKHLKILT